MSEPNLNRNGSIIGLYALVIGIDTYKYARHLTGCAADARDIVSYLTCNLSVPSDSITTILDAEANRVNILQKIEALANNNTITKGSPILIYFAGHGAKAPAPKDWIVGRKDNQIEMLCPWDFNPAPNSTENEQGIPDITFLSVLENLAEKKGNNITVILDSCHSASGTRIDNTESKGAVSRGLELPESYHILPFIDVTIRPSSRLEQVPPLFESAGAASHILLAACSKDEAAKEENGRGKFTEALTRYLRHPTTQTDRLTYEQIIGGLDIHGQKPHCEGRYSKGCLFRGMVKSLGCDLHSIRQYEGLGIIMDAGMAHGIVPGAHFDILPGYDPSYSPVSSFLVTDDNLDIFHTVISNGTDIPPIAWARHTFGGYQLPVRFPSPGDDNEVIAELRDTCAWDSKKRFVLEPEDGHYELSVTSQDGSAIIQLTDKKCLDAGLRYLPNLPLEFDSIYPILNAAPHFFWHLRRKPRNENSVTVTLEAWELSNVRSRTKRGPTGENLCRDGVIRIPIQNDGTSAFYGYNVQNLSGMDLYVWIFSFNFLDLSISEHRLLPQIMCGPVVDNIFVGLIHKPSFSVGKPDLCLPAGGTLPVGFGNSGTGPRTFVLPQGLDLDLTYLKIFVSTQYLDLSSIEPTPSLPEKRKVGVKVTRTSDGVWNTLCVPVIQRRQVNDNPGSSNLFALVIGINHYPARSAESQLRGAVRDAENIVQLLDSLGVLRSNICTLLNAEATRAAIIKKLMFFADNTLIEKDRNTIFIYFAGHGSSVAIEAAKEGSPEGFWDNWDDSRVEILCPYDEGVDVMGKKVFGIPDKAFVGYLNAIAQKKGNNIVVMLDCCHSASMARPGNLSALDNEVMTRTLASPTLFDRGDISFWSTVLVPDEIHSPATLKRVERSRKGEVSIGFRAMYNRSHILLAACGRDQQAKELKGDTGGVFTTMVLNLLKSTGNRLAGLSYRMMFQMLPHLKNSGSQTPHCDGFYVGRQIFSLLIAEQEEQRIQVVQTHKLEMMAGAAHGIQEGATVSLFKDKACLLDVGVSATVTRVEPFRSELGVRLAPGTQCFARFQPSFPLLVFFSNREDMKMSEFLRAVDGVEKVTEMERSYLILTADNGGIHVSLNTSNIMGQMSSGSIHYCGYISIPDPREYQPLLDFFPWARRFIYHLLRSSPIEPAVSVELYRLRACESRALTLMQDTMYEAVGPNLVDQAQCAHVGADGQTPFGVILHNHGEVAYYYYCIFFDSDLEIGVYFQPQIGINDQAQLDGKLYGHQSIRLGFGGATAPLIFNPGVYSEDVSICKVIFATHPIDISSLKQASAFDLEGRDGSPAETNEDAKSWGSISVVIIQTRT
ncbi:caspase domain-containing protein [Flagelloscypha sp. PMI_526]|nr:caspase domain-containing protein [Flagelloscypha sp. PMI_526]